jgi:cellulose synthase/poly-beta-1,6-N-acetylglucosamine synthase-like glycosyltransferase
MLLLLLLQDTWEPMGRPLERFYHKPTATAPPDQPHVTVVIPTHSNTQQLLRAVQSAYAQDYQNWELLIVGDKCPLLDAFMEQHKQLFAGGYPEPTGWHVWQQQ